MNRALPTMLLLIATTLAVSQRAAIDPLALAAYDTKDFSLLRPTAEPVFQLNEVSVFSDYRDDSYGQDVVLRFVRNHRTIYKAILPNLMNPNGSLVLSPDGRSFAINWSDGGATGGWHSRLFQITNDGVKEKSDGLLLVAHTFRQKHFCATRGNNLIAVRWLDDQHLLVEAEVYPTGDCGPELGYTDRFVLNASVSKIERRIHVPTCVIEGQCGKERSH